jgi:hypothetical protein
MGKQRTRRKKKQKKDTEINDSDEIIQSLLVLYELH